MGLYADIAVVANQLLSSEAAGGFGQGTVTLTRTTTAASAAETPWIPGAASTSVYALKATVKAVSEEFINGTSIVATDLEVTCSTSMTLTTVNGAPVTEVVTTVLDLQPGDVLSIDGVSHSVQLTMRVPAAGTPVVWKFVVKS